MSYKQTKPFNQASAGHATGYCLQNVRKGYSINSRYATANEAWQHTQQHTDAIPDGVDVPLFYSYQSAGHINVQLASGKVWSDGVTYANLQDYLSKHKTVHYQGWGESINGVAVLEYAPLDMPAINSQIHLSAGTTRTTYHAGTTQPAGQIHAVNDTYTYTVRGYDPKYPGRILINSASAGGDGVALALYYVSGNKIEGWNAL